MENISFDCSMREIMEFQFFFELIVLCVCVWQIKKNVLSLDPTLSINLSWRARCKKKVCIRHIWNSMIHIKKNLPAKTNMYLKIFLDIMPKYFQNNNSDFTVSAKIHLRNCYYRKSHLLLKRQQPFSIMNYLVVFSNSYTDIY